MTACGRLRESSGFGEVVVVKARNVERSEEG